MFKIIAMAGALCLGILGFASSASAGTNIDIGVGLGLKGGGRISCREGARIVRSAGYREVRPTDCSGSEYTYNGARRGGLFQITLKSKTGRISDVDRIRRRGWDDDDDYGDYDDDY